MKIIAIIKINYLRATKTPTTGFFYDIVGLFRHTDITLTDFGATPALLEGVIEIQAVRSAYLGEAKRILAHRSWGAVFFVRFQTLAEACDGAVTGVLVDQLPSGESGIGRKGRAGERQEPGQSMPNQHPAW